MFLWLLPLLLPRITVLFPCHLNLSDTPSPRFSAMFIPTPLFSILTSPFRRRIPLWFTYCDIYSYGGSFTLQFGYFARINIWRHSGSRTYTSEPSVSDTITVIHRCLTDQTRWCSQLDEFPGTLYFTIFTFYRSSPRTLAIQLVMQTTKLRRNRAYNRCDCTRSFFEVLLHQTLWSHAVKKFSKRE